MENIQSQTPVSKKLVISGLVVTLLIIMGILGFIKYRQVVEINKIKKTVPDYFINSDARMTVYQPTDLQDYKLLKGQNLSQNGLQYQVVTPYKQAIRDILTTMNEKGWTAIGGSGQTATTTIIKMNNGANSLFITIEDGSATQSKTTITILSVLKSQ